MIARWVAFCILTAASGCASTLPDENPAPLRSGQICRPSNFQGCCSWNGGVADERTGICHSGKISSCDSQWRTSLQGRCSYNQGVASVSNNGVVYCNNDRAPGTKIPKCSALKN